MNREVASVFRESYALARLLPDNAKWSVMITNDSAVDLPVAFNVYVRDEQARLALRQQMQRSFPVWECATSEEHKYTPRVTLGIIQEEE